MNRDKQRAIASKGGKAAHEKGTAHQFTIEEARAAGRKGGGKVSEDRQHMSDIGRIGGQKRGAKMSKAPRKSQNEVRAEELTDADLDALEARHSEE